MKVFGGSILSHYSRWCPVQARLVQSLETKWEGKRERQRKAKREKDVGYSLNSLFVSVIYTSKIVLGRERTDQFILSAQECSHTSSTLLGCIMKAKVRLLFFFYFWACQTLQSSLCRCNDGPFQSYPCIYTQICLQDLSQVQHWPPAGLAPYPPLLISTTTKTHTHTNPLPPFSKVQLIPTWSQFMGEEEMFWSELTLERWERRKYMPSLIFLVSLSRTRIVTLCAPVRLTPTITPKATLDGVLEKPMHACACM